MKERGSHGALRILRTWTNGANGSSDIEGKVAMGSGENGAAGRERHRWANREVDMGGST
jgi:hypothetical protein